MIPKMPTGASVPSYNDVVQMQIAAYNATPGELTGYDCPDCLNKGYIAKLANGSEVMAECRCMKIRDTLRRIRESGLERQLKTCTFKSFETEYEWQRHIKNAAADFADSDSTGFFIGGQSGCGKTHICTAIIGRMIKHGHPARYFVWREESTILKALINDREYSEKLNEFKKADVLYIDDLFKQDTITDADKRLAFELIDYRLRQKLCTVISTELDEAALIKCDEALAGRIFQLCRNYRFFIPKDPNKNYRLRK